MDRVSASFPKQEREGVQKVRELVIRYEGEYRAAETATVQPVSAAVAEQMLTDCQHERYGLAFRCAGRRAVL